LRRNREDRDRHFELQQAIGVRHCERSEALMSSRIQGLNVDFPSDHVSLFCAPQLTSKPAYTSLRRPLDRCVRRAARSSRSTIFSKASLIYVCHPAPFFSKRAITFCDRVAAQRKVSISTEPLVRFLKSSPAVTRIVITAKNRIFSTLSAKNGRSRC